MLNYCTQSATSVTMFTHVHKILKLENAKQEDMR